MPVTQDSGNAEILARVLQTVAFDESTADDFTVVTVVTGRIWALYELYLKAEGAVDVTIKSGSTALSGPIVFADTDVLHLNIDEVPHMKGAASGDNLIITLSAAVQVSGWVTYALGEPITQ